MSSGWTSAGPSLVGTTNNTVPAMMPVFWDAVLGENLFPNLVLYGYGSKRQVPRNFGVSIKIPRLKQRSGVVRLWAGTLGTSGQEGNAVIGTVPTCAAQSEFVSGTLKQFLGVYRHSDIVVMTALSDVVNLSLKAIARDLALQMDTHARDQISGSGTRIMGNGLAATTSNSGTATNTLRSVAFLKASTILDANNNPRPAGGHYPAIIHPFEQFDLQSQLSSNAWLEVNKYKGLEEPENLYRAELGRLFGCALTTSTNVARVVTNTANKGLSAGASGWQNMVFAPEAFYVTEISDMTAKTYVKQLGSGGTFDPVNTVATVGAKVFFTAIPAVWKDLAGTTNPEVRMVRITAGGTRY